MILEVKDVTKKFGGITAINNTSFSVENNQIYGLIGPNGAGKTTLFNIITGNYKATSGQVWLNGQNITNKKNYKIVQQGIARTFQNIRLFSSMSVEENILIGFDANANYTYLESMFRLPRFYKHEKRIKHEAFKIMEFLSIDHLKNELATSLSYGEQRRNSKGTGNKTKTFTAR
jgi:branched-chain amino acid transport system ATP-binding protein